MQLLAIIITAPTNIEAISIVLLNASFLMSIEYVSNLPFSATTLTLTVLNPVNSSFPLMNTSALLLVGIAVITKVFSCFILTV